MAISILVLAFLLGSVFEFSIGNTTFGKHVQNLKGDHSMYPNVFSQTGWDGPTGSFTSCDIYALRVGDWLWYFTVTTDDSPKQQ
jgi:hypothetical protein